MRRSRAREQSGTRFLLLAVAGGIVVTFGAIFAMDLLTRSGGAHHQATITQAPDTHPAAATTGGPDLHFTTTSADLGVVPLNTEVGYAFSYANTGAKTLRIQDVNVRAVRGC
jgi:hypothetical protein